MGLILFLIIAAVAAWIAEHIVGAGPYGFIGTLILGVVAILIGVHVLHIVLPGDPIVLGEPIISSILWCVVVDLIYVAIMRNRRTVV